MNYVFSFRARSEAIGFYDRLKREGIAAAVVNTPQAVGFSCGLSVRVPSESYRRASELIAAVPSSTFLGAYERDVKNGGVRRL